MTSPSDYCLYGGIKTSRRHEEFQQTESRGIRLSLMIVDSHFIDWGTTQGRLSLPTADVLSTIVKQSMLTDVDKLSSCGRYYRSKDPTNSIKVLKEVSSISLNPQVTVNKVVIYRARDLLNHAKPTASVHWKWKHEEILRQHQTVRFVQVPDSS